MYQIWYTVFSNVVTVGLVCNLIHDSHHWECWLMMVMLDLIVGLCCQCETDFGRDEQLFLKLKLAPSGFQKSAAAICSGVLWGCALCHTCLLKIKQLNDIDLMQFHTLCYFSSCSFAFDIFLFLNMGKSACICFKI